MGVTEACTAANQWSDEIDVTAGYFDLSIWRTFVATITVQRTFDSGTNWLDVETFTTANEWTGHEGAGAIYRVGIKTGEYTSGTANVRISV